MKSLTSAENMLERKVIHPNDSDYGLVPLMAIWHMQCPRCKSYIVAKSRIGVLRRWQSHFDKCPQVEKE